MSVQVNGKCAYDLGAQQNRGFPTWVAIRYPILAWLGES